MSLGDCLSSSDISQLKNTAMAFISTEGDFLVPCGDESLTLVAPKADGLLPDYVSSSPDRMNRLYQYLLDETVKEYIESYFSGMERKKISAGLSEFIWPSDEGETQVEFRSPVRGFPPRGQLRVVITNMSGFGRRKRKASDEYCLAADKDGTVKWLPESDCVERNNIWTVQLFERRGGEVLYLRDQLRRTPPNVVYNNCEFNYIGGNVNGSGTQTIGNVTATNCTYQSSRFTKVYQLMQKFSHIIS